MPDNKEVPMSGTGCLVRSYWIFIGTIFLWFCLVSIFLKHQTQLTLRDAAYFVAVAALIIARHIDIRFLNGLTYEGKPATMNHLHRYTKFVGAAGVSAWLLVRILVLVQK